MPDLIVIHAAVFAAGALLGGGAVAAFTNRKQHAAPMAVIPPTFPPPIVEVGRRVNASVADLTAFSPVLKYGNPGPVADQLVRQAYVAAYDRRLRHPAWTAEHLTLASLGRSPPLTLTSPTESVDRSNSTFREDASIPPSFRSRLQDYFRSGYDRGHMVPAADAKISQEAMNETFLLSNIAPQVSDGFNRHYWAYLEDWCRRLTGSFADVYIFTVPLYLPRLEADGKWRVTHEVIGSPPNVAVPTHFAKVVLTSTPLSPATPGILALSMGAFVLPNASIPDDAPLESFIVPVADVERSAGLTLFSDAVKSSSRHICQATKCQVMVRRFDDAQKRPKLRRAISAPK